MGIAPDAWNASQLRLDQRRSRATKRIEEQIRLVEIKPLHELPNEMGRKGQYEPIPVMDRPIFSLNGVDPCSDSHTVIFTSATTAAIRILRYNTRPFTTVSQEQNESFWFVCTMVISLELSKVDPGISPFLFRKRVPWLALASEGNQRLPP